MIACEVHRLSDLNSISAANESRLQVVNVRENPDKSYDNLFNRLLKNDGAIDDKLFQVAEDKDLGSKTKDTLLSSTDSYIGQRSVQAFLGHSEFRGLKEYEKIELYDQKNYATGKLSYINRNVDSTNDGSKIDKKIGVAGGQGNFNSANSEVMPFSQGKVVTEKSPLNLQKIMGESELVGKGKSIRSPVVTPMNTKEKYEREKITEISDQKKLKVFVRSYYRKVSEIESFIYQKLGNIKNSIVLIINGIKR